MRSRQVQSEAALPFLKRLERSSGRRIIQISDALTEITSSILRRNLPETLLIIAESIRDVICAESCRIFLVEDGASSGEKPKLVLAAAAKDGLSASHEPRVELPLKHAPGRGLTSYIADTAETICLDAAELELNPYVDRANPPHLVSGPCYSTLGFPVKNRKKRVFGVIRVDNKKGRNGKSDGKSAFSAEDIATAKMLANYIVFCIEAFRPEVIFRSIVEATNSATSLEEILTVILQKGLSLVRADRGAIALWDPTRHDLISYVQIGGGRLMLGQAVPSPSIMRSVWSNGKPRIIPDVGKATDYLECDPLTMSELAVRLEWETELYGVINVESYDPGFFDDQDSELLQQIAQYAVTGYQMVDKSVAFGNFFRQMAEDAPSREKLLRSILESICEIYHFDAGVVYFPDYAQNSLRCSVHVDPDRERLKIDYSSFSYRLNDSSLATIVFHTQKGRVVNRPWEDPEVARIGLETFHISGPMVAAPLCFRGKSVGVLVLWRRSKGNLRHTLDRELEPYARLAAIHVAHAETDSIKSAVLKATQDILKAMNTEISLRKNIRVILRGVQAAGFDCARAFVFEENPPRFVGLDCVGNPRPDEFLGTSIVHAENPYAADTAKGVEGTPRARLYDPTMHPFGLDPHRERLGKADSLPWVATPLVIAGRLYGQITADNRRSGREISNDTLEWLELFGALAALAIANADRIEMERAWAAEFLAMTAGHEMKNSCQALGIMLGRLREASMVALIDEALELMRAMNVASATLFDLVTSQPRGLTRCPAANLIKLALETLSAFLLLYDITVNEDFEDAGLEVEVDPQVMVVVILNVIRNSIDAMEGKENGFIEVSVRRAGSSVELIIDDNGSGFTEQALAVSKSGAPCAFERDFTTKGRGHSGLGLWMVRRIMHEHGGYASVYNRADVVTGARVILSLPCPST